MVAAVHPVEINCTFGRQSMKPTSASLSHRRCCLPGHDGGARAARHAASRCAMITPTIQDAEPGSEPAPEDKVVRRSIAASRFLPHQRGARHDHHRYLRPLPLPDPGQQRRVALRHRRRPRRLPVERAAQDHAQGGVAGLDAAARDDRAAALSAALHGRRPGQSDGRPRALSRQHRLPHPWHQRAGDDRTRGVVGLLPAGQRARSSISTSECRSAPR